MGSKSLGTDQPPPDEIGAPPDAVGGTNDEPPDVASVAKQHLAAGMGQQQIPQSPTTSFGQDLGQRFSKAWQGFKGAMTQPYNSGDPFGPNAMKVLGGIGAATNLALSPISAPAGAFSKQTALSAGMSPEAADVVGDFSGDVAATAVPGVLSKALPGKIGKTLSRGGKALYEGQFPPVAKGADFAETGAKIAEQQKGIDYLFKNRIPVSRGGRAIEDNPGLAKLQGRISAGQAAKDAALQAAEDEGVTVNAMDKPLARNHRLAERLANQVNPDEDLSAVNKARNEYVNRVAPNKGEEWKIEQLRDILGDEAPDIPNPGEISPTEAESIKKGTYASLGERKWLQSQRPASTASEQSLVSGLKSAIAEAVPKVGPINEDLSGAYAAQKPLLDATRQMRKREFFQSPRGVKIPVVGEAGGATRSVLDTLGARSRAAFALDTAGTAAKEPLETIMRGSGLVTGLSNVHWNPDTGERVGWNGTRWVPVQ